MSLSEPDQAPRADEMSRFATYGMSLAITLRAGCLQIDPVEQELVRRPLREARRGSPRAEVFGGPASDFS